MNVDFRELFQQSPVGLALTDMKGKFIECNQTFAEIVGLTIQEVKNRTYWDLTPENYYAFEREILERIADARQFGPYEKEYYSFQSSKNGAGDAVRLVQVSLHVRLVELGGTQYLLGTVLRVDRLSEGFRQLFQQLPAAFVVTDIDGNAVAASQEYANLIGRPLNDVLNISYWNITPEQYKKAEEELLTKLKKDGKADDYIKHYIHRDEHLIPVSLDCRYHVIHGREYLSAYVRRTEEIEGGPVVLRNPIVRENK